MTVKAIVGRKAGMTQVWSEDNHLLPVTVIEVQPVRIVRVKTVEKDGYNALQVTFGAARRKINKPEQGHFDAAGVEAGRELLELRMDDVSGFEVGQEIPLDTFEPGDMVDVSGISKGKGFAGVMKRHNFAGQRATHGAHLVHRMPGSIGQCATPARVFKGKKMAGHMGNQKVTQQNLVVVKVDTELGALMVKGAVPGAKNGLVTVKNAVKKKVQA
ncbi:MAG: 50S ribosomal protein L3 [Acidimicrobiales bacterium]|nr:50S ribosomal protein L3 [Acidimicrobiales bacterium]